MPRGLKVLVCGGRDYSNEKALYRTLDELHAARNIGLLVVGGAGGADTIGELWAHARGVQPCVMAALWKFHGKAAGLIRNSAMEFWLQPDVVVHAPGGPGTADMVAKAKRAGIELIAVRDDA
jgi:hypothetical protein